MKRLALGGGGLFPLLMPTQDASWAIFRASPPPPSRRRASESAPELFKSSLGGTDGQGGSETVKKDTQKRHSLAHSLSHSMR